MAVNNATHHRSNADKRRAVVEFLSSPENRTMSDRAIARECGVGYSLVADVRNEICPNQADEARSKADTTEQYARTREEAPPNKELPEVEALKARIAALEARLPPEPEEQQEIAPEPPTTYTPRPDPLQVKQIHEPEPTPEELALEMERRERRVQEEIERRQNGGQRGRPHSRQTVKYSEMRGMSRIELEDLAIDIGLRPRDLMLPTQRLMTNIEHFRQAWIEAVLEA